jgi:hypothetical protein
MVSPSYSLTATERVLPRLALDFTTDILDPRVTVTRSLNTATRINSSGYIETVNANLPRFDYNSVTQVSRGLLIEETRTNFVLRSNTLDAGTGISVTVNAATSPDGTTNAYRVAKTDATTPRFSTNDTSMTVAANTTYTASRFVKYDGYDTTVSLEFNSVLNWGGTNWRAIFSVASTGVTVSSELSCTASVQAFKDSWYRITATFTTGATVTTPTDPTFLFRFTGTSGVTVLGYGTQLEAGAFATSYIPTTTTSLTRNADVVSMTGTNFSDWYNATEGTFMANVSSLGTYSFNSIIDANDGTTLNRIGIRYNSASVASGIIIVNNVQQGPVNPAAPNAAASKFVLAYKADSFAASYRASTVATDTSGTVPTVSQLEIGNFLATNGSQINGHFIQLSYYPLRLTNNEVQAFSK